MALLLSLLSGCGGGTGGVSQFGEPEEAPGAQPPSSALRDIDGDGTLADVDCDDADALVWRTAIVFEDGDLDGIGVAPGESMCIGELPSAGRSLGSGDCSDDDATVFTVVSYEGMDLDRDGYSSFEPGELCTDGTLPAGLIGSVSGAPDCDDRDYSRWRMVTVYEDVDGDSVGSGNGEVTCVGAEAAPGLSFLGYDPLDTLADPNSTLVREVELDFSILVIDSATSSSESR